MPQLASSDVKWLSELPDELEVFIAIREFEDAVAYIEKGQCIGHRLCLSDANHTKWTIHSPSHTV